MPSVEEIDAAMKAQGVKVRELKTGGADKAEVDAAIAQLLKLKEDFVAAGGVIEQPASSSKKKKKGGAAPEAAPAAAAPAAAVDAEAKKKAKADEKEAKKAARKEGKSAAIASKGGDAPVAAAKAPPAAVAASQKSTGTITVFPGTSIAIAVAAKIAGVKVDSAAPPRASAGAPFPAGSPAAITSDGVIAGAATVLAFCCAQSPALAPSSPLEAAQVQQWLSFCTGELAAPALATINAALLHVSYLAGNHLTAADLAVFAGVHSLVAQTKCKGLQNLQRWFDHVQHDQDVAGHFELVDFGTTFFVPEVVLGAAKPPAATSDKGAKKEPKAAKKGGAAAPEGAAPAKAKEPKGAPAKAKEAKVKEPKAAPAASGDWNVGHMEFTVGTITKCWEHPDSDKLWCEEIEVGEAKPRQIASGLRHVYPEGSSLTNRKVLIVSNLKARKLGGFPSHGMVLCASSDTGTKFVEVPAGVPDGEKVTFEGFPGPASTPAQVDKKKIFDSVAPGLVVAEDGTCTWNGTPFTTSKGVCTAPGMAGAHIK